MRKHGASERSFVEKWDVGRKILCNFMCLEMFYISSQREGMCTL